jgi:hypothetical protein
MQLIGVPFTICATAFSICEIDANLFHYLILSWEWNLMAFYIVILCYTLVHSQLLVTPVEHGTVVYYIECIINPAAFLVASFALISMDGMLTAHLHFNFLQLIPV